MAVPLRCRRVAGYSLKLQQWCTVQISRFAHILNASLSLGFASIRPVAGVDSFSGHVGKLGLIQTYDFPFSLSLASRLLFYCC